VGELCRICVFVCIREFGGQISKRRSVREGGVEGGVGESRLRLKRAAMVHKTLAFALLFTMLGSLVLVALILKKHLLFNALKFACSMRVDNLNLVHLAQSHVSFYREHIVSRTLFANTNLHATCGLTI
jgi:hypothetical protein